MKNNRNNKLFNDAFWYLIGAIIPMAVLIIRSPIFTRIFSPADYGYFSLVSISFTYLSSLSYVWITSCAWRYYLQYKNCNKTEIYQHILIALFSISSLVLICISVIWILIADNYLLKKLIIYGFIFFTSNELINVMLIPMRIDGRSKKYNILHGLRAVISFCLLLTLTFVANIGIESFFLAGAIINILFVVFILINKIFTFSINLKILKENEIKQFVSFGSASIVINICLYFLISSDRYILAIYRDISEVGIYNQIYNIAQISLVALINVYLAAINPWVFEKLESTDKDKNDVLSDFAYKTIFLFLPVALFMTLLAKPISYLLLGPEFRDAYYLLPFILFGVLFNGMNNYETSKFKFRNKIKIILLGAVIATIINIGLNFIFIPKFGMLAAAVNTTISYIFLWAFYYIISDLRYLTDKRFKKAYLLLFVLSLIILTLYIYVTRSQIIERISLFQLIAVTLIIIITYFLATIRINPFINDSLYKFIVKKK